MNSLKQIGGWRWGDMAEKGGFVSSGYIWQRFFSILFGGRGFCFCLLVIGIVTISSCSLNREEAWSKMQGLEGRWTSEGSILVNQRWMHRNDGVLAGFLYAHGSQDTLPIEDYTLIKINDSLFFQLGDDSIQRLRLDRATRSEISFYNEFRSYPNRIILQWESDSVVIFRKENMRGNMPIAFRLKRGK